MAVTERGALTCWPSVAPRPGRGKSWVLAMLAPKRGLRVAPVPPRAADLTRSKPGARGMPGRDEGIGPLNEPRNHQKPAAPPCCQDHPSLTVAHPIVGETEHASHTEIRTLPPPPHRSRRAACPHRALVEGRTRSSVRDLRPSRLNPQARRFSDMLNPAQSPEHALLLAFPPTGRLPSALSAADL